MQRSAVLSLLVSGFLLLGASLTAAAADFSCMVSDAAGDLNRSPGQGFDGATYQDILATSIERAGDTFVFTMNVADAIPGSPELRTPHGLLLWMWGMNTDPAVPFGLPLGAGVAGLLDFWIHLAWDGVSFDAVVIDRRPTLVRQSPVVTPVDFSIQDSQITLFVPAAVLGDLGSFSWGSSTWIWPTHLGTSGAHRVDQAPDVGGSPCPTV